MKKISLFVSIFLATILTIFALNSVQAQNGNQSDVTFPTPLEIVPGPIIDGDPPGGSIDRGNFQNTIEGAPITEAVEIVEEFQATEFSNRLGLSLFGNVTSIEAIQKTLDALSQSTSNRSAIVYVVSLEDRLELLLVPPSSPPAPQSKQNGGELLLVPPSGQPVRQSVPQANRALVERVAQDFRTNVSNPSFLADPQKNNAYVDSAKQLYQWIIAPLEPALQANQIKTLVFSLDSGLRTTPVAALYDGQRFLVEQYSVAVIPSFSLTDTRYVPLANTQVLAMGISQSTQGQAPLPSVAVEVPTVTAELGGEGVLNEASTIENLREISSRQRFRTIHLATHAEFRPGQLNNSYIQFWNEKLPLGELRNLSKQLQWNADPKVELLVLSACETALGNLEAELGFAGLALQSGVKAALGSLWQVSDEGTLGLMSNFYDRTKTVPIKAEALRQAQLAMLRGEVRIEDGQLRLSESRRIPVSQQIAALGNRNLSHPFFWSAFTLVGNWN